MNHSVLKTIGLVWLIAMGVTSKATMAWDYYNYDNRNLHSNSYDNTIHNIPCNSTSGCR